MKNLLLFSTLILTSVSAFSQLTVKPNGAADSYIYVNDQVLFVNQYIDLTRNGNANNQEASIYLRNNGQLIQGGTSSTNSGNGQLSVQQNTPVTNAWAYYYWCSPITHPAAVAGNRSFGVQHLYEPLSASVTAAQQAGTTTAREGTTSPMTISTRWLYTHMTPGTEAEGNYTRMNANNAAPAGFGFTMKGVGTTAPWGDQVYDFRGRPNNGDFTIPVEEDLMTLSGNPYPSSLDLNKLFYEPGNEELKEFWYYDEDRSVTSHNYSQKPFGYGTFVVGPEDTDGNPYNNNNLGNYVQALFYIWNAGGTHGGTSTGSGLPDNDDRRFAPVGQGIMFVGDTPQMGDDGNVIIKNSHRIFFREGNNGSVFQRPGGSGTASEETVDTGNQTTQSGEYNTARPDYRDPQMRLYTIFDEAVTRDMLIVFYDQATDGYDRGLDGSSPMGSHTDAYFPVGNDNERKPYVINAIKYELNKQIPIAFKLKNQTKFAVKAVEEVKKPYTNAYIFDSQQHTYQQITGGQSASFNLPAGVYENRFYVVFRSPNNKMEAPLSELEEKNTVMEKVNFFQNNPAQQLEVYNPEGYSLKSAAVYDMSGKLVITDNNLGDSRKYSFYTGNLSDGVYLVKLTTSNNLIIDYKAIVHNK